MKQVSNIEAKRTILFAILVLFFIQLLTLWVESVYRMSLTRLAPGKELFSFLLVLFPLALLASNSRAGFFLLRSSILILLAARALSPLLGNAALTVVAGIGTAAFLLVLCCVLSAPYRPFQGDLSLAVGIAVLLSVLFRCWGSSCDISMEGRTAMLGWLLAAGALYLFRDVMVCGGESENAESRSWGKGIPGMLGLFANLAIIYWVLSSPAVVSAWSGSSYLAGTSLLVFSLAVVLFWCSGGPPGRGLLSRPPLIGLNVLFVVLLAGGIWWHAPLLPPQMDSPPVFLVPASPYTHMPFYLMFVLSPVVLLNIAAISRMTVFARPRDAVFPVLIGMVFLLVLTTLLIGTNVWGYMGAAGLVLRNKFYLPFLVAGMGSLLPLLMPKQRDSLAAAPETTRMRHLAMASCVLAVLAIAGVLVCASRPSVAEQDNDRLTIMTYNMQQGSDVAGDRSYREQLELLHKVGADIIGLQESDTAKPSGGNVDAVRYFADGLHYFSYCGPSTVSGTFGVAILSRFPLAHPRTFFTFSNQDEIGTAMAEIEVAGRRIAFFNNHPAGSKAAMTAHMNALLAEAARHDRVIAVGDFNFHQGSPWYDQISAILNDSWLMRYPDAVGKPYPMVAAATQEGSRARNGAAGQLDMKDRIDHIFLSHNFQVLDSYYLLPPESKTDHPAHWSVIGVK